MKKKYVAPKGELIRFDVEDILTKRLPLKNYLEIGGGDVTVGSGDDSYAPPDSD